MISVATSSSPAVTITFMFALLVVFVASVATILCIYYADQETSSYSITAYVLQGIVLAIVLAYMISWMVLRK